MKTSAICQHFFFLKKRNSSVNMQVTDLRLSPTNGLIVPVTTGTKVLLGPHDLLKCTDIWSKGQKKNKQKIIVI